MARPRRTTDEELLERCRRVFLDEGLTVSTRRLAAGAGVSEGVLFQRFRTKDELFFAAMHLPRPTLEDATRRAMAARTLRAGLLVLSRATLEYLGRYMPSVMLVLAHPEGRSSPRAHELLGDAQGIHEAFRQLFDAAARTGRAVRTRRNVRVGVIVSALLARAIHEHIGLHDPAQRERWLREVIAVLATGFEPAGDGEN